MFTLSITYKDGITQSHGYEDLNTCAIEFAFACVNANVAAVRLEYYVPSDEEAQQLSDEAAKSEELSEQEMLDIEFEFGNSEAQSEETSDVARSDWDNAGTKLPFDQLLSDSAAESEEAENWKALRKLLGYVQDGSSTDVTISQDDATMDWVLRVGKRTYYARSLETALREATQQLGD